MTKIVVGVDGGGTQTRVMIADETGRELFTHETGGSAVHPGGGADSASIIAAAIREALAGAEMTDVRPRVLSAGVAGTGRERERSALHDALVAEDIADDVVVTTDASIALDDAFGEGPGILLIAGTGSMGFGRSPAGRTARAGGWGPILGDEGSGGWIGHRALSVVTSAADGREPETALSAAILAATECDDTHALVAWAAAASRADFASLAPIVITTAEHGDLRANSLLTLAVEELVLHVRALARDLFVDERAACPLALGGGLLRPSSFLRRRLEHRLRTSVPGAQVRQAPVVPVRGAVRGALRVIGAEV